MNRVSRSCRHILEIFCCSTDAGSDIFLWLPDVKYEYMMPVDSPKKCTRTQQCQYVTKFIILPQHTTALKFEFVTQGCHIHFRNQWTLYSVPGHLFFSNTNFPVTEPGWPGILNAFSQLSGMIYFIIAAPVAAADSFYRSALWRSLNWRWADSLTLGNLNWLGIDSELNIIKNRFYFIIQWLKIAKKNWFSVPKESESTHPYSERTAEGGSRAVLFFSQDGEEDWGHSSSIANKPRTWWPSAVRQWMAERAEATIFAKRS